MRTFLLNFYRQRFASSLFVLKLSGKLCDPTLFDPIAKDIAELHEAGIQVVVVHGGGIQIDAQLAAVGHSSPKHDGRRITDAKTLRAVQQTVGGTVNQSFVQQLCAAGLPAVGLNGGDGGMVQVVKRPVQPVDFGFVGDVQTVDPKVIQTLVASKFIPVIGCMGCDPKGQLYNVNADTVATEVAIALHAKKLIFLTDTNGIQNEVGATINLLKTTDAEQLMANGVIRGGMAVKAHNAIRATKAGVARVHVLSGAHTHALHDEIFSAEGVGTMIVTPSEALQYSTETA